MRNSKDWRHMAGIPDVQRLRLENPHEFKTSLGFKTKPCLQGKSHYRVKWNLSLAGGYNLPQFLISPLDLSSQVIQVYRTYFLSPFSHALSDFSSTLHWMFSLSSTLPPPLACAVDTVDILLGMKSLVSWIEDWLEKLTVTIWQQDCKQITDGWS